jgi:hypothetical protein
MKKDDIQTTRDMKALASRENYSILVNLLDRFEKDMIRREKERKPTRIQGDIFRGKP